MLSRRTVLRSAAVAPLAAVLADPELTRAAAASTETVTIATPGTTAGGTSVSGALALPTGQAKGGVLCVHEWWGLNDQIKAVAAELAREGYVALACDLYDGTVATEPGEARALTQSVDAAKGTDTVVAWVEWLRKHPRGNGKVATMGWCFGGGWSLNASLAAPVDATVIYYGNVKKTAEQVAALRGPVLGHFATQDQWINQAMVSGFEQAMAAAGKQYTSHWYDAQHAFANPTTARYDAEDAASAWSRTLAFLARNL